MAPSQTDAVLELNCWVRGDDPDRVFSVEIANAKSVAALKDAIKEKMKPAFDHIPANTLKLWQVDIPADEQLSDIVDELGLGQPLRGVRRLNEVFFGDIKMDHVHVLIRPPSQVHATTTQVSDASDQPRLKRRRLESPKRTLEDAGSDRGIRQPFQDCVAIYDAIKAMPDNLDLSDPTTFTELPFPSLNPVPTKRFEGTIREGVYYFEYMGRSMFRELQDRIKQSNFLAGHDKLYLYGTSGSGKSHLLAALVYNLIREGNRVVYIPDCRGLLQDPGRVIWDALRFAFYDSASLSDIENIHDVDKLIRFMSRYEDLYIIVDQLNALEVASNNASSAHSAVQAMKYKHRYIFSASANEETSREADGKQTDHSVLRIFGGMSQDETDQWFIHHSQKIPQLSPEQRQLVEYLTGCIPLLLRCLLHFKIFVESDFRDIPELRKVNLDINDFFSNKYASLPDFKKERYLMIMKACVRGDRVNIDDRKLYDLRYFYVDEHHIGQFTCGLAFESMLSILRTQDGICLLEDSWYSAVSRSSINPVVRGFLAEQICLSSIATTGLRAVDSKLGRMSSAKFESTPNFGDFLSTDHETRLYVPIAYNFNYVDGVILLLNRTSKQASMFPLQFTLSMKHKKSDEEFYTKLWPTWIEPITLAGFTVQSTFVWIDKKQPSDHVVPAIVKALRSGNKVVRPEYSVVHVGVDMVDQKLGTVLGIK